MNKTFLVMRHEFLRHVTRRSFLFAVLGLPSIFLLVIGGAILFFSSKAKQPVGVIDPAGILLEPAIYAKINDDTVPFTLFDEETAVQAALTNKEVQAYFIVPANYLAMGQVTLYHNGDVLDSLSSEVRDYFRASLLADSDPVLQERFRNNWLDITVVALSEEDVGNPVMAFIVPFAVGYFFIIAIMSTSGFLIQAVVDEKENRTMEILITSLKPSQLLTGKIIGLISLGLIQITVWLGLALLAMAIARANIPEFPDISIQPTIILIAIGWFVPLYVLMAALVTAIGISITAVSEGQQIIGIISMLSMSPMFFLGIIAKSPDSPFSVMLSLIPFSAPLTILTRSQLTAVPTWQYLLSWSILAGTAVLAIFLVGRLMRFGMLRYGKKLAWREVTQAVRRTTS